MDFLKRMLLIRRVEYRIAELPILGIPVVLLLKNLAPLHTFAFWEGVFLFLLLFAFGDIVNCLADRDLDAIAKPHLSDAVQSLGIGFVKAQLIAYTFIALFLGFHLAWELHRWLIPVLIFVGIPLGAAYSVPPVRTKGRGILHAITLWAVLFVGPMLLSAQLVSAYVSPRLLLLILAFATQQTGIVLVNSAEDYQEDSDMGVRTTIVALGLKRGILLALALVVVGALTLFGGFLWIFQEHGVMGWPSLAPCLGLVVGAIISMRILRVYRRIKERDTEQAAQEVKTAAKEVPLWITSTAWAAQIAALLMHVSP